MNRIDLHLHSDASDGAVPAEILVARAALSGLTCVAVTEHDNVDSWERVRHAGRQNGVGVIPGIEMSTRHHHQDLHLLGYDFSPKNRGLRDLLEHQIELRHKRFRTMLRRLKNIGVKLAPENIHTEKTGAPGRVHIAQALVAAGVVPDVQTAFERYLRKGRPAYVPYETISTEDAIHVIHAAGGFTSLAHPVFCGKDETLIEDLAESGLDAVEVLHPKHSPALQERLSNFCKRRNLMSTGGSDWHGTLGEPYDLGEWYLQANGRKSLPPNPLAADILKNALPVRPRKRGARPSRTH
ncbi:PHP domain-containing protein [bacterium]|nr:PHP domain-containing protein [bacterium]